MRSRRLSSLEGSTASISCRPRFLLEDTISQGGLAMLGVNVAIVAGRDKKEEDI
jgi:hypothetical protein